MSIHEVKMFQMPNGTTIISIRKSLTGAPDIAWHVRGFTALFEDGSLHPRTVAPAPRDLTPPSGLHGHQHIHLNKNKSF